MSTASTTRPWDLLVRGGTLLDPARAIAGRHDVAFSEGRVAAVAPRSRRRRARWPKIPRWCQFTYVDGAGNEVKATRRFRTRHVVREGRRLPAAHADLL